MIKANYKQYLNTSEGTTIYNKFKEILYGIDDSLVKELINYCNIESLKNEISICDLGGGDGRRLIHLVKLIQEKKKIKVSIDLVEQSKLYTDFFKNAVKQIDFVQYNIYNQLIENFVCSTKYDITLLIHSIFCLSDPAIFDKILSCSKKNGEIFIVSNSENSFLATLKSKIDSIYIEKRYEISNAKGDLLGKGIHFSKHSIQTKWRSHITNVERDICIILQWLSLGRFINMKSIEQQEMIKFALSLGTINGDYYCFSENEEILIIKNINK